MPSGLERDLRDLIAQRRVVVVVGSGVSIGATRNAPAASWTGLLKLGVARCRALDPTLDPPWEERVLGDIASGRQVDLLSAAEKVSSLLGAPDGPEFARWLRESVGALDLRAAAALEALRDLGLPLVTTNYDDLLEQVTGLPPATWRDQNQVFLVLRGEERAILHVHGHWRQPDSVVLGIRSYEHVRQDAHEQAVIRALAMGHSLLFVGCGDTLTDPNFKPFLSWLRGVNARNEARHYRLALRSDVETLQAQHPPEERIFVLPYGDDHSALPGFLRRLAPCAKPPEPAPSPAELPPTPGRTPAPAPKHLPPGLRAFSASDHDWFLRLLPAQKDRGLPASLWFWKTRLEQGDPDRTFKIGLLHGRSGCGKSSLVKAGLVPALSPKTVLPVYVEATPKDTVATVERELRKALDALRSSEDPAALGGARLLPSLVEVPPTVARQQPRPTGLAAGQIPANLPLEHLLATLRVQTELSGGRKIVLLLDQFEQWLDAHRLETEDELTAALRLCDGSRLQAVLMVRTEFLDSAMRFLEALGVPIRTLDNSGRDNTARAELFEPKHAQAVLIEYGRAYGPLPESPEPLAPEQQEFVRQVVANLSQLKETEGKVVCVHLALLADLLKERPWTPARIAGLGGVERVGFHFLKEQFGEGGSHRRYRRAAMAVLGELLPQAGDIRGRSRSEGTLRQAAIQADNRVDFSALMQVLNDELRLVTVTDRTSPDNTLESPASTAGPGESRYQLTHDYLVPSLREWLAEEERKTRAGRATRALRTRAAQWDSERKIRYLPSPGEYLRILLFAPRRHWNEVHLAMFRAASIFYGLVVLVLGLLAGAGSILREHLKAKDAGNLVQELLATPPPYVPFAVDKLRPSQTHALPLLRAQLDRVNVTPERQLNAALALAAFGDVRVTNLLAGVTVRDGPGTNLVRALTPQKAAALQAIQERIRQASSPEERVRLASLAWMLGELAPLVEVTRTNADPATRTAFIHGYPHWPDWPSDLAPLKGLLEEVKTGPVHSDLRSAVCAALGVMALTNAAAPAEGGFLRTLADLYIQTPDSGTHGAAAYALARWGQPPDLPESTRQPAPGRDWFVNTQGMTMVRIPAGSFRMGHPQQDGRDAPPHVVAISRPFYISDREVTVTQFRQFHAAASRPAYQPATERFEGWKGEDTRVSPDTNCPVQQVSWLDAVKFCNWLSRREGRPVCYTPSTNALGVLDWQCDRDAAGYRLPTEAEWEYACRAGSESRFAFGDDQRLLGDYVWYQANSLNRTWPSARKLPNLWGLFDMHGNVWEWCHDWYDRGYYVQSSAAVDPPGPSSGDERVLRGGSWVENSLAFPSCSFRDRDRPVGRGDRYGFRCVLGVGGSAPR